MSRDPIPTEGDTERLVEESARLIDGQAFTDNHVTVGWRPGDDILINDRAHKAIDSAKAIHALYAYALQALIGEMDELRAALADSNAEHKAAADHLRSFAELHPSDTTPETWAILYRAEHFASQASRLLIDHCTATDTGAREDKGLESAQVQSERLCGAPEEPSAGKYKALPHTPGPWVHDGAVIDERGFPCVSDADGMVVCAVVDDGIDEDTQDANAHLISAAPDLFAACRAVWLHLEYPDIREKLGEKTAEMVRAALAKAGA